MVSSSLRMSWDPRRIPERWRSVLYFTAVYWMLALGWWDETMRALARPGVAGPPDALPWFATIALATRGVGWMAEAGFYVLWWRAWGRRLPFGLCLRWIVVLSACSLAGQLLARLAQGTQGPAFVHAIFAGPGALGLARGPWAAFGDAGLLAAARIALTADVQARALGIGRLAPLALCAGAWLATRIAIVLLGDLARGRSPWP